MKIAIINASSQRDKNEILYRETKRAVARQGHEVVNLGVFSGEKAVYSYIQISLCVSLLLESGAAGFVVTGCSSGTGMMLACNSLPGVLCGYLNNPTDAYLYGRINDGNAMSFPLGLGFGWAGEMNFRFTVEKLFEEPFGIGYPEQDAQRKRKDTQILKSIKKLSHRKLTDVLRDMDQDYLRPVFAREPFYSYLREHGENREMVEFVKAYIR